MKRCPKCGYEFEFNNESTNKGEVNMFNNKINETITGKNEVKEMGIDLTTMGFDMNVFAKLVAQHMMNGTTVTPEGSVVNVSDMETSENATSPDWAKTSKFHKKEICGYAYNPYTVRRWVVPQLKEMIRPEYKWQTAYGYDIHRAVRSTKTLNWTIDFCLKEIKKLAMLEERDPIAFVERKNFWSVKDFAKIFYEYLDKTLKRINLEKETFKGNRRVLEGVVTIDYCLHKMGEKPTSKYIAMIKDSSIQFNTIVSKVALDDYSECLIGELNKLKFAMKKITEDDTFGNLKKVISEYGIPVLCCMNNDGSNIPVKFIEGYKKTGAFYYVKNEIMFNDMFFNGKKGRAAIQALTDAWLYEEPYKVWAKFKDLNLL